MGFPDNAARERLPDPAFDLRRGDVDLLASIASHGSLRAAARRIGLTQSTARRRVLHLERSLNARLLCNSRGGARLTDGGWALLRAGRAVLDTLAHALGEVRGAPERTGSRGMPSLRIAASGEHWSGEPWSGEHWEDVAADLAYCLPRVLLDLTLRRPSGCRGLFERYDVDGVYGWDVGSRPFVPRRPALVLTVLVEPLWAMMSADHPGAGRGEVALTELSDDAWVLPDDGTDRAVVLEALRDKGVRAPASYLADSGPTLHSLVAHGHGVALASPLKPRPAAANLTVRPVVDGPVRRAFLAVDPTVVPEPVALVVRDRLRVHYARRARLVNPEYFRSPTFPLPPDLDLDDAAGDLGLLAHLTVGRTLTPIPPAVAARSPDPVVDGRLELEHLHLLRVVERAGSLNRAAPQLLITQPGLTRRVSSLERAAGVVLLRRTPRGTMLSAAGRQLLARTETAEAELAELVGRLRRTPPPSPAGPAVAPAEPAVAPAGEWSRHLPAAGWPAPGLRGRVVRSG